MEKIWLKAYPPSVPAEIDASEFDSLKDLIEHSCAKYADQPAYENFGSVLTFSDVERHSRYFGAFLQKQLGLVKGDRVAVMLPNVMQYPIAVFGALRAGLVVVNVNPMYTARELQHQLEDAGATTIIVIENFARTVEAVADSTPLKNIIVARIGDLLGFPKSVLANWVAKYRKKIVPRYNLPDAIGFRRAQCDGKWQKFEEVALTHDDHAFLQYTGGTTGVAKGAVLTHGNLVSNVLQARAWFSAKRLAPEDAIITALPLYHIFSLTANCFLFTLLGGRNVLITNPRDMPGFVEELGKHRFGFISGVNTLFNGLLHTPGFAELDFSALKITLGGGMAVQRAVAEQWQAVTGQPLYEGYGLTETSPAVCINPLTNDHFTGAIGLPISSTEVTIRDDAGRELPQGETGELCVRGPQVMKGYWNRPDETAKVMLDGCWFRTGDIGHMDETGYVYIDDRKKDMIVVSGFKVFPNEVEAVLAEHPGIVEGAAVGVPDAESGEVVKVFVVRGDKGLTEADVLEHCRKRLTGYKRPKHVEFRDELPKTNVGKILRRALREEEAA